MKPNLLQKIQIMYNVIDSPQIDNPLNQGLLYLDGRNSQKYLHQTQADF